ncbi:MarR family winged helix-turn-helix transcriptional regulator [Aeromicrobium duanguangcaii]|uniref:MarR family winged helix-turn-helix transcriptional regulator n=1 Tax=Aeromicrobium duanguangcaii TaxID=2968086 RepID=A0ABY5KIH8_9ACTN|nr:MarR family winged helix-turn-helix transcriptional regulator [Aeromicrobium duanguangcaii]MCD9154112.1 MarR family winged helix-turn-helix transcriptional regulator [Aeromicrobium duanguangcaii]UUI68815.1 MarR family winged helix-turn-helix transcriptional regulator [Aeromicrobium duanguangcaii]
MTTSPHACAFDAVREFLGRVFTTAEGESLEAVAKLKLSFTQARVVFTLAHHDGPAAIGDLAGAVGLSAAAVGRNIEQLVRKKLVVRTENPEDRRVKLVAVSALGRSLAQSHLKSKEDAVRTLLDALEPEQCLALVEALKPLKEEVSDVN